jgi:hypothetical protein
VHVGERRHRDRHYFIAYLNSTRLARKLTFTRDPGSKVARIDQPHTPVPAPANSHHHTRITKLLTSASSGMKGKSIIIHPTVPEKNLKYILSSSITWPLPMMKFRVL